MFISVANGTFDTELNSAGFPSQADYGNAYIRLTPQSGTLTQSLPVTDYWTMYNTVAESDQDEDLGSGSITLIPDFTDASGKLHRLGVGSGKDANLYVVDQTNMGKFSAGSNSTIFQVIPKALNGREFSSAAYFSGTVYFGAATDVIRAFKLNGQYFDTAPAAVTSTSFVYPGTTPSISANNDSDGIVWALDNVQSLANGATPTVPAILHAYAANNLRVELYNSNEAPNARDQFGPGNKFIVPTVAGGKVFVGTGNSVAVFGLLSATGVTR